MLSRGRPKVAHFARFNTQAQPNTGAKPRFDALPSKKEYLDEDPHARFQSVFQQTEEQIAQEHAARIDDQINAWKAKVRLSLARRAPELAPPADARALRTARARHAYRAPRAPNSGRASRRARASAHPAPAGRWSSTTRRSSSRSRAATTSASRRTSMLKMALVLAAAQLATTASSDDDDWF